MDRAQALASFERAVREVISDKFVDSLGGVGEETLLTELDLGDLDSVEVAMAIEDDLKIDLPDEDLIAFRENPETRVKDVVDLVIRQYGTG